MGLSVTKELACGGPFMQRDILRISVLSAPYDGAVIFPTIPADYANDVVQIHYNSISRTLQGEGKVFHIVHVTLPSNMQVQINRWNERGEGSYINAKITMSA